MKVRLEWLTAGACSALDRLTIADGSWRVRRFPARFGLIHHPVRGPVLFDTGYAPRFFTAARHFPYRIYTWLTPVHLNPGETAVEQLARRGIPADQVQTVILSHFHGDHVAGLLDFPQAQIVCSPAAYQDVAKARGWAALRKAFLPDLMPHDIEARLRFAQPLTPETAPWLESYDVFGDRSCRLVELPGHAVGQMGLLLETEEGPVLLAADACWQSRSFRENIDLHPLIHRTLTAHRGAFRASLAKLVEFHRLHPEVAIYPTHCPEGP